MKNILEEIKKQVEGTPVVLYMKGSKAFPMCGFSALVCQILDNMKVEYTDVNILESEELRSGIKEFSNWPTIPQLYINGEFVGGSDIVKQLFQSGELHKLLKLDV